MEFILMVTQGIRVYMALGCAWNLCPAALPGLMAGQVLVPAYFLHSGWNNHCHIHPRTADHSDQGMVHHSV